MAAHAEPVPANINLASMSPPTLSWIPTDRQLLRRHMDCKLFQ